MNAFLALYSIALALISPLLLPAWFLKMKKRGGLGTGLRQRIGIYPDLTHLQGLDYYHAVSVGEAVMAVKVIKELRRRDPQYKAIVAVTTATGHEIARKSIPDQSVVIYAPLDFKFIIHKLYQQLSMRQVILVDSELWPNMLDYTRRHHIPLRIINGRLSESSFRSYSKLNWFMHRLLGHTASVCVDSPQQAHKWHSLGVKECCIHVVGSLKFDFNPQESAPPAEFSSQLGQIENSKHLKILLASTHPDEEQYLSREIARANVPHLLMVAPRHAERRDIVQNALRSESYSTCLRSQFTAPEPSPLQALIIDTTGELAQWMSLADLVVIGKSWLDKKGGQNPFEAIAQGKCTICGPHMNNFSPLIAEVENAKGVVMLSQLSELTDTIQMLNDSAQRDHIGAKGKAFLSQKLGATHATADTIQLSC